MYYGSRGGCRRAQNFDCDVRIYLTQDQWINKADDKFDANMRAAGKIPTIKSYVPRHPPATRWATVLSCG